MLQYLPVESFATLRSEVLSSLESAVLDASIGSRIDLLRFYSALITEWEVKLRVEPSVSEESLPLTHLIQHAELLASTVQEFTSHGEETSQPLSTNLPVLEFYQSLARTFAHAPEDAHIRLSVPPAALIYTLCFAPSVSVISALSSILTLYKSAFETSLTSRAIKPPNPSEPLYDAKSVGSFNGYVMDVCNMLWRNRGLNSEDPNARACLVPKPTVDALSNYIREVNEAAKRYDHKSAFHCTLANIFSLSHNAAYSNLSAACFRDLEDDQPVADERPRLRKPVAPKALQALEKDGGLTITWQEYRVHMLDWLDGVGSHGMSNLMRSTMKALRKE